MSSAPRLFTSRFAALWFFQFATFFSVFQLLPVIPLRILDLGGSKAAAGSFLFVYTIASAFSAPMMGSIADQFGRRRMLIIASVVFIVFSLLYGIVSWLPLVLLIGVAHGALWSSILASAGAIMAGYIPAERRTEGLAYWGLAPTMAMTVAPAVGLWVFEYGWFAVCCELAAISVITSLWATRLTDTEASGERVMPRIRELWDWQVVRATGALTVVAFGQGGVTSYAAIMAMERGIKPESLFFTAFAGSTIVIRILAARLGDRFGPKALLYPSLATNPIAFTILAYATTPMQVIVSGSLFGIGMGLSFPAFMNFIVTHTDERRRGRTFGSVIWAFDTGIGIGSLAVGMIGQRYGLGRAFLIAAALSCLAIPIFAVTTRRMARGTAVAGNPEHAGTG